MDKTRLFSLATVFTGALFLYGCGNMPTNPSQITGAYVSPVKYEKYTCEQLANEMSSLARRENQLVIAQEQRIKSSKVQAFWVGYGNGDGVEASELANVRGEREAVRFTMEQKRCANIPVLVQPQPAPQKQKKPTEQEQTLQAGS